MSKLRIKIDGLTFFHEKSKTPSLNNVSFEIKDNEYVCIMGANGSGKSTLLSCINGLETPPGGTCFVYNSEGRPLDCSKEEDLILIRQYSGTVMQNPENQIVSSTVEEDVAFTPENQGLGRNEVEHRVSSALAAVNMEDMRLCNTGSLSGGQKQRLAIAGILAFNADVLLLDEPDSMLDPQAKAEFNTLISNLILEGKTILRITHNIEDALLANRCIVLNKGSVVYDGPSATYINQQKKNTYTKKNNSNFDSSKSTLVFNDVCYTYKKEINALRKAYVKNISFNAPAGASIALTGRSGSGKSTVLRLANALILPDFGDVLVLGRSVLDKKTDLNLLKFNAALAVQNPESALFENFVCDDVAYGPRNKGVKGKALLATVKAAMESCGLPYDVYANRNPCTLSGGEKRRAALAGIIAMDAQVYLLDEPTAGLDMENTLRITALLEELKASGKTIVAATHSQELAESQDFLLEIRDGELVKNPLLQTREKTSVFAGAEKKKKRRKTGMEFFNGSLLTGDFLDQPSLLRDMNAKFKFISMLILGFLALAIKPILFPLCIGVFSAVCGCAFGKIKLKNQIQGIIGIFPISVILFIFQFVFSHQNDTSWILLRIWRITLTAQEMSIFTRTVIQFAAIMNIITLYAAVTPMRETLASVKSIMQPLSKFGFPVNDVVLACGVTFRFVPILIAEGRRITEAQLSRGARLTGKGRIKTAISLVLPLFLRTLERSQILAAAIVLRGYR
ncbi:MAG: ATP-binding cassette domain-containing protein [Spirochaetaceae bacterium]|jgi:energy-coupling factor transport system ATP-binding protein|nr:ATP-binding cassette domain-containing protein [Spirochaetaceae bacterium]